MDRFHLCEKLKTAIVKGDFTLSAGSKSSIFLDVSKVFYSRDLCYFVNELGRHFLHLEPDAVGGPALGAAPLISGMMGRWAIPLTGFLVRKEPKGIDPPFNYIEGIVSPHQRVVMVEDVTTSGSALLTAINRVKELLQIEVILAISIVDRESGASELMEKNNIPFKSLFKLSELLSA